jgi:glycosyltransferase involved in cell wall biosynthesis
MAIDSIVSQTFLDWELVIINDGSTDQTEAIINRYIDRGYRITYHYQDNKGLAFSRNKALELSKAEYVAFIDHDDIWMPEKLQKQMALLKMRPELGLVYSDCFNVYPDGQKVSVSKYFKFYNGYCFERLLLNNFIVLSTAVVKKEDAIAAGGFKNFKIIEEYDLFLKISYNKAIDYIPECLSLYRYHDNNASRNIDVTLQEIKTLTQYWSSYDNQIVKSICAQKIGWTCYKMSRSALFHLMDRGRARELLMEAFKYEWKCKYLIALMLCLFPIRITLLLKRLVLLLKR